MTIGTGMYFCAYLAIMRAAVSTPPPAAKPTTIVSGSFTSVNALGATSSPSAMAPAATAIVSAIPANSLKNFFIITAS